MRPMSDERFASWTPLADRFRERTSSGADVERAKHGTHDERGGARAPRIAMCRGTGVARVLR